MTNQYPDSAATVNLSRAEDIKKLFSSRATGSSMGARSNKDEPMIELLRWHIRRGEHQWIIAKKAGCSQARVNQILKGNTSVKLDLATDLATKAFGYPDFAAFAAQAYRWSDAGKPDQLPTESSESAREHAIRTAREYGVSTEQLTRVFARLSIQEYEQQPAEWWFMRMLEEKSRDAEKAGHELAQKRAARADKRREAGIVRQSYKEAGRVKKKIEAMAAVEDHNATIATTTRKKKRA